MSNAEVLRRILDVFKSQDVETLGAIERTVLETVFTLVAPHFQMSNLGSIYTALGMEPDAESVDYGDLLTWLFLPTPPTCSDAPYLFKDILEYSGGCTITHVEERGISLEQLSLLYAHIEVRCLCEDWRDRSPKSKSYGDMLVPCNVNLYQVVDWVVLPATSLRKCSFVELVAIRSQTPAWFVSHWWGEPLVDFIRCIREHISDRRLTSATAYWVCAYANNQWRASEEVGEDPSKSSFRAAMGSAQGTLSILDEGRNCYNRIWCVYEVFISLDPASRPRRNYLYDIYTTVGDSSIGLSDGLAAVDARGPSFMFHQRKGDRERSFPADTVQAALQTRLQDADSSVSLDKQHILNTIAGQDLDAMPLPQHASYDKLNATLAGRFASAGWRNALENGTDLTSFAEAIRSSSICSLDLAFTNCTVDLHVRQLASALPQYSLKKLSLDFCNTKFDDGDSLVLAHALPNTLVHLKLDLSCTQVLDGTPSALASSLPSNLEYLELGFGDTQVSDSGCLAVAGVLPGTLQHLELHLHSTKITDDFATALAKALPASLKHLDLRLGCTAISDAGMCQVSKALPAVMTFFSISVASTLVSDMGGLSLIKSCPVMLEYLRLDFHSTLISDASACVLADHLSVLPALQRLDVQFGETQVSDHGAKSLHGVLPGSIQLVKLGFSHKQISKELKQSVEAISVQCLKKFAGPRPDGSYRMFT